MHTMNIPAKVYPSRFLDANMWSEPPLSFMKPHETPSTTVDTLTVYKDFAEHLR